MDLGPLGYDFAVRREDIKEEAHVTAKDLPPDHRFDAPEMPEKSPERAWKQQQLWFAAWIYGSWKWKLEMSSLVIERFIVLLET
ncbi:hypothetical protein C5167_014412 [Papaver somniferum]|uniref:Uncharacterized protein n=1 Tax=Papaver somniferum TaxID=3469 RepID=A0A4Y7J362_PAPSO|nr:hypothetical protein C5167_014412 [Papaver somniferum]